MNIFYDSITIGGKFHINFLELIQGKCSQI